MLISFIRTVILYIALILGVRVTGKRQLGDLEPAELIVTILITELAAVPLQDPDAPLLNSIISILALICLEILLTAFSTKSPLFNKLLQGKFSVLIRDGEIDQREMKRSDVTYDELSEAIRQNGALSPDEVRWGIMEPSGNVSIILKKDVTAGDIPTPLILQGKYLKKNLKKLGLQKEEIETFLAQKGLTLKDVYVLALADGKFTLVRKEKENI
jgi:uncharacterized membrane protein YcaP (DUF421 family)